MIKVKSEVKPNDSSIGNEVLIKTTQSKPYYGAYFTGYYAHSQSTWKIYLLNENTPIGGSYVPISQECIEYYIPLTDDNLPD